MQISKTKSEAGILVMVVFLLGVLVGGVGYRLWGTRVFSGPPVLTRGPQGRGGPPPPLSTRLNMTPDQQKLLDAIFTDARPQFQAIDAQRRTLNMQTRDKIRAILTPDQQAKFDEMMKQEDSRGRGRGPGGPGGPPPGGGGGPGQGHGGPGF